MVMSRATERIVLSEDKIEIARTFEELTQKHQRIFARIVFFSKEVWSVLKQWLGLSVLYTVPTGGSIHNYWQKCRAKIDKDQRRVFDGIMIYLWWNVWK